MKQKVWGNESFELAMLKGLTKTLSIVAALTAGLGAFGAAAMFVTTSMPTASIAAEKTISGKVMYRERIALPPEAHLIVQLTDVSLADAPSKIIAETTVNTLQGVPIPFAISFDTDEIEPSHSYALQARIVAGDTLWFVNDERYSIDPKKPDDSIELKVVMVRKSSDESTAIGIEGKDWLAEDIQGGGVVDTAQTTLLVDSDGTVSGSGGCNRFMSKATISGSNISFAEIGSTYMQCPPALMNQERKFLDILEKTRSYKMDAGKLVLIDEGGDELARLAQSL